MYTPLVDGDTSPTLYLAPGDATDFTMEITVGIVDADPCSASAATTFAATQAGVFGQVGTAWHRVRNPASWSVTADGEASEPLSLTFQSPYQAPEAPVTRTLTVSGLPDGVEWERIDDEGSALRVSLTTPTTLEPGEYSLTWSSKDQRDEGGVLTSSRASASTATLTVLATPRLLPPRWRCPPPLRHLLRRPSSGLRSRRPHRHIGGSKPRARRPRTRNKGAVRCRPGARNRAFTASSV